MSDIIKQDDTGKNLVSSGVEALITRLREEGVRSGEAEAERILAEAEAKAQATIDAAKADAEARVNQAKADAEALKTAAQEDIRIALRDATMELKQTLVTRFEKDLRRLVSAQMKDEAFLRELILEVAARTRTDNSLDRERRLEVILPHGVVGLEDLRQHPEKIQEGTLSHFVLSVANDMLQEGVTFTTSDDSSAQGISVRLADKDIILEFTDEALTAVLLGHLNPRFRAFLEGVIR